jgi:xylan 1,4-beta-xylosidase
MLGASQLAMTLEGSSPASATDGREVSGVASLDGTGTIAVLLVAHDDDWDSDASTEVTVTLTGLDDRTTYNVVHTIIDVDRANSHTAWLKMGSPQTPDDDQIRALIEAARLSPVTTEPLASETGLATLSVELPAHAVHLVQLMPVS